MKFGVREITDVTFRTAAPAQTFAGVTHTNAFTPVLFFDSAKTSTVESAVATVYAQGGRGNPRLLAWDGDKTVTFTFEEALISPASFSALSGADMITGNDQKLHLSDKFVGVAGTDTDVNKTIFTITAPGGSSLPSGLASATYVSILKLDENGDISGVADLSGATITAASNIMTIKVPSTAVPVGTVIVDYYVQASAQNLQISAGKFAGYYYLEANTLFRGVDGKDYAAQFTIPKAKVQSNFTFTMAGTGEPSTFTFTLDAFPAPDRKSVV